jgi:flavin reductase (DIM6/NTAB) family NADH-FMN oxidoreductase RutF
MVTSGDIDGTKNIITLAWAGTVCSTPPMVAIGVRPSRFSYNLLKKTGEFVVNLATVKEARALDLCGVISGRDGDKFAAAHLTPLKASKVKAPLIAECPVNIECVVRHTYMAGSHEVFLGEVVAVNVDEARTDGRGYLKSDEAFCYHARSYFTLRESAGAHGFSAK